MGEMRIMAAAKGDDKLIWDSDDLIGINVAKKEFEAKLKQGYLAFKSEDIGGQKRGEQIYEFDPNYERIILAPPMRGG